MFTNIRVYAPGSWCCIAIPFLFLLIIPCIVWAQPVDRFSVVIDELFPDPSPAVGLPGYEFVELKNISSQAISLHHWKLSDGSSTATIQAAITLAPDSFLIVCPNAAVPFYQPYGATIGVSNFPSLNNDGDVISLYAADGTLVHTVTYTLSFYKNDIKKEGGWTLEMIDTRNPCAGLSNWTASSHPQGGTPGKRNAADAVNTDETPPALIRTYTINDHTIVAVFDEPVDSSSAAQPENYSLNNGVGNPALVSIPHPISAEVHLHFAQPLQPNTIYQLSAQHITDCAGNAISAFNSARAGLPQPAATMDVVINELLFNPPSGGFDYAELYNSSNTIVSLDQLYLAGRNSVGALVQATRLAATPVLLFPGDYVAFTESEDWLRKNYVVRDHASIRQLSSLPSLPDDKGTLVLTNMQGGIVDELQYDHKWHFALLGREEGVALERINYNDSTNSPHNWTSAATSAGYGTPGYQNSQFRADLMPRAEVSIFPTLFSPDNSGGDDFVTIQCTLNDPGYVINIIVFDVRGRPVRRLIRNALAGTRASFRWDGLDDNRTRLPRGPYIIFTEIFNTTGNVQRIKKVVTLAK